MNLVQPLLILGIASIAGMGFLLFRTAVVERLLTLLCAACALFFVLFPMSTTFIANKLGVGRGADLLVYFLTLVVLFFFLLVYMRFLRQDREQTAIVRYLAVQLVSRPEDRERGSSR